MSTINDFGLFLKNERELRGIPLEEIANTTKIHMRFLTALENNDYSEFPGEVFIKGYIRSYAKSIGTNVETILSAYEESVGKQRSETLEKAKTEQEKILMTKTALRRNILVGVFLMVFAVAGYFLTDIYKAISKSAPMKTGESSTIAHNDVSEQASADKSADMTAGIKPEETELPPGLDFRQSPGLEQPETGDGKPAAELQDGKEPAAPSPISATSSSAAETKKIEPPPVKPAKKDVKKEAAAATEENKAPQINVDDAKAVVVSSNADKTVEEKDPLRLHIKATENSWFNVTVDGSRKMDFMLSAGASKSLSGKKSFKVTIGNKNGAELALNGHSLPLPDSEDNVVRDFQITPKLIE